MLQDYSGTCETCGAAKVTVNENAICVPCAEAEITELAQRQGLTFSELLLTVDEVLSRSSKGGR